VLSAFYSVPVSTGICSAGAGINMRLPCISSFLCRCAGQASGGGIPSEWSRGGTAAHAAARGKWDSSAGTLCCHKQYPCYLPLIHLPSVTNQCSVPSPCYLQPLSPLQEVPDSPEAAAAALLEEEQQQRGGMFSRLLVQLFDQSSWQQDPTWHHSTAGKLRLRRCVFRSCHGC
jgi:hypothetical protein